MRSWLSFRTHPRASRLADWAQALGTSRSSSWIAECGFDAFLDELCMLHGSHLAALSGSHTSLCGTFACYSRAWSPAHRGQIIRGTLRIVPDAAPGAAGRLQRDAPG